MIQFFLHVHRSMMLTVKVYVVLWAVCVLILNKSSRLE